MSADGGTPEPLTTPTDGEISHRLPQLVAGGNAVVYTVKDRPVGDWRAAQVVAQSLETGAQTLLLDDAADARYVPSGHLVFVRRGTLMAAPFDVERLAITGGPVALLEGVAQAANIASPVLDSGAAQFATSDSGLLAYVPGGVVPDLLTTLAWVDLDGNEEPLPLPPGPYVAPRVSPDARRIAVLQLVSGRWELHLYDLARGGSTRLTPLTMEPTNPVWSPDGQRVAYGRSVAGTTNLVVHSTNAGAEAEGLLTNSGNYQYPGSWSRHHNVIAFNQGPAPTNTDIWVLPMDGDQTPRPVVQTPGWDFQPAFSPDGRWLAYVSDGYGTTEDEVYVQAYPGPGSRHQVSTDGGREPMWSADGRQLFYWQPRASGRPPTIMAVDITTNPAFTAARPRELFDASPYRGGCSGGHCTEISPDGQRFLLVKRGVPPPLLDEMHIQLVFNWFSELEARVPVP